MGRVSVRPREAVFGGAPRKAPFLTPTRRFCSGRGGSSLSQPIAIIRTEDGKRLVDSRLIDFEDFEDVLGQVILCGALAGAGPPGSAIADMSVATEGGYNCDLKVTLPAET